MKIILVSPDKSNGGIASWTRKFTKSFPSDEYQLVYISQEIEAKSNSRSLLERIRIGFKELNHICSELQKVINIEKVDLLHLTTSGSLGCFRDYCVAKFCQNHHLPCIIHYRIGCIPQFFKARFWKWVFFNTMKQYDQIWVLDKKTYEFLSAIPEFSEKVRLTPNSIEVNSIGEIKPKLYKKFVFIANILPTKGIFELIKAFIAVKDKETELHILGPGTESNICSLKKMASDLWGRRIIYHGQMPNDKTLNFLEQMDSMILPTYYAGEAFPISILEAMSKAKLIISTPRAAIPDMLLALDGTCCGIIVDERSINQLSVAIDWVCEHKKEADILCRKAYEKVYHSYRTDIVYEIYRKNYTEIINKENNKSKRYVRLR